LSCNVPSREREKERKREREKERKREREKERKREREKERTITTNPLKHTVLKILLDGFIFNNCHRMHWVHVGTFPTTIRHPASLSDGYQVLKEKHQKLKQSLKIA
jgi:hypothetical protein